MKWLIALALVGASFAFQKEMMLNNNRIPMDRDVITSNDACTECKSLVDRFVEASHDQAKMAELKILFKMMCETSGHFKEECELLANNIDVVIKRLEPYLKDSARVCKSFHMCSNNNLDAFRRIGMLYVRRSFDKVSGMKSMVCDECQFAANELKALVDDKEQQKAIHEFFSKEVCIHAGSYRGMCDMLVEQFLPEFFQELDAILADPKKACQDVGFCAGSGKSSKLAVISSPMNTLHPMMQFWENAQTLMSTKGSILMSCLECKVEVDSILVECEDQRYGIAKDFQGFVCNHVLPANFTPSCEDFMSMYLPTVLYMTFKQFSGEGMCTRMHTCDTLSLSRMAEVPHAEIQQLSGQACVGVQNYIKDALLAPEHQHNFVALSQMKCDYLPSVMHPVCHDLVARVVPRFMMKTAQLAASGKFCEKH